MSVCPRNRVEIIDFTCDEHIRPILKFEVVRPRSGNVSSTAGE